MERGEQSTKNPNGIHTATLHIVVIIIIPFYMQGGESDENSLCDDLENSNHAFLQGEPDPLVRKPFL